jgi:hypothetical protein
VQRRILPLMYIFIASQYCRGRGCWLTVPVLGTLKNGTEINSLSSYQSSVTAQFAVEEILAPTNWDIHNQLVE